MYFGITIMNFPKVFTEVKLMFHSMEYCGDGLFHENPIGKTPNLTKIGGQIWRRGVILHNNRKSDYFTK